MSADRQAIAEGDDTQLPPPAIAPDTDKPPRNDADVEEEEEDEEDEEDEEPKLKSTKLTGSLTGVYRNGDSSSAFTVAGDKMVVGTYNGNVHVFALPDLRILRTYNARSVTITSVSVSPIPPPPSTARSENGNSLQLLSLPGPSGRAPSIPSKATGTARAPEQAQQQRQQPLVPNIPSNQIYIATSSLDGRVCIQNLTNAKDVQLRNFARPISSVALSPDYKNDRTYLTGGLSGQLILTVGGKAGVSADANTNSAAAAASGWLGSIGLGSNTGKDTVLHSGEGSISTVKWSLSGKWVVWVNEEGIKIMRSHLKLDSEASEDAWRRVAHAAKPNRKAWVDMAGVWKGRAEWVDERKLESDEVIAGGGEHGLMNGNGMTVKTAGSTNKGKKPEKLVVGWGDMAWILLVHEGGTSHSGARQVGSADNVYKLQFRDCIVAGISMYTPSVLAILAYRTRDDDDKPIDTSDTPRKGRHRRTGLPPELRLVNAVNGEEVDAHELSTISRFESLSAQDYQLGSLYMPAPLPEKTLKEQRGALEAVWEASGGNYASRLFNSGASVMSQSSSGRDEDGRASFASPKSVQGVTPTPALRRAPLDSHPYASEPGLKLFVQSPYDCILAVKRDLSDRLEWLLEHQEYPPAWQLIDEHPEAVDGSTSERQSHSSQPGTPSRASQGQTGSLAEFLADSPDASSTPQSAQNPAAEKEKRRIGDLWLQQLIANDQWVEAGKVAGKVLGTSTRWEHWAWTFAQAKKFDEITPYIPATGLPGVVYEVVLGHYIAVDRPRLKELLETYDPELFDVSSVITAVEDRLGSGEVTENTIEGGEHGRDWRILVEALARLYLAAGRARDALRCYVRAQNADAAMKLIKEENMMDAIADDVPGLLMLRVSKEQMRSAPLGELEDVSSEAVKLLVEEAHRGTVAPATVIRQLQRKGASFQPFLFFYLRALWRGPAEKDELTAKRDFDSRVEEGHALVEDHADLAIDLFAEYDRDLFMTFLRASSLYSYEKAATICEHGHFIPELVYILSKTGQTKRALSLIIGELGDVSQAIAFAKENGELWDDLLDYSMNKPRFIRGLLEEVGTAIDPIQLVRRIPEGLEIEGLKEGIQKMVREYEIQFSISEGVARVLRGEVAMGMDTLRAGRKKAVRFEVGKEKEDIDEVDLVVRDVPSQPQGEALPVAKKRVESTSVRPGHCVGCRDAFHEEGKLVMPCVICKSLALTFNGRARTSYRLRMRTRVSSFVPAASEPGHR